MVIFKDATQSDYRRDCTTRCLKHQGLDVRPQRVIQL